MMTVPDLTEITLPVAHILLTPTQKLLCLLPISPFHHADRWANAFVAPRTTHWVNLCFTIHAPTLTFLTTVHSSANF